MLPLSIVLGLRVYDTFLMRQTERQLAAQAALIAAAWSAELSKAGLGVAHPSSEVPFDPINPQIDLGARVLPPQPPTQPCSPGGDPRVDVAARAIEPLIRRAQRRNLSAVRLVDVRGCVVATTRGEAGHSLAGLPEVDGALGGRYSAAARVRISDSPAPPLTSIRRRGDTRIFAALPVSLGHLGHGAVRVSRTSLSALESLWLNRRGLFTFGLLSALLLLVLTFLFARAISRPLRRLRDDAEAIVEGQRESAFAQRSYAPRELNALAEALTRMTEQLAARAEYTAAYATDLTHELKTPITAIRGATELLGEDWASMSKAQRQRFLGNIEGDAQRMERLVNQLLALTRIENSSPAAPEPLALEPFFGALRERYEGRVEVTLGPIPNTLSIEEERLRSATVNLLENALQHGAPPVRLHAATSDGGRLRVVVSDEGPGIPEGEQARVFERFYTTQRDAGGTGLGLAMVKAIAESRGGTLRLESAPGKTRFELML